MSRQRYMVRRVGALVVVALVLFGVVRVVGALAGGDDGDTVAGADGSTPADATAASDGGTVVGATGNTTITSAPGSTDATGAGSTVPATSAAVSTGPPTAADPAVVLIAGDSDAGTFGPYLETLLDDTGVARTQLDYKVSSGLSRPDFFDWPSHFRQIIPQIQPDIVVVTFGGNDPQGLTDGSKADGTPNFIIGEPTGDGDAEWRAEYGRRVGEVMDYLASEGRTLVWVGIPNDDNPDVTTRLRVQDEVVRAEAAKRPQVAFVDTWKRFSGREGGWAEFVIDPRDSTAKDVRADDGFHLNTVGAEILALDIMEVVRADLVARGAQL
ncbi:MAG: DUF459 domain-containing protein [Acidimicrobiales bacterium]|nr:DUF459 domain-containing protein [Acidimicrobiales bacterium]